MSDFTSNFWSVFVTAISVLGIVFCAALLWFSGRIKVQSVSDNTTGHVWDENLAELNNTLPRWWLWLFIITIVFAVVYWFSYPGMGAYKGSLGWTSKGQYDAEVAKANQDLQPLYAAFDAKSPEDLSGDPKAMAVGERSRVAVVDAAASGRMAVAEALLNLAPAAVGPIGNVKLSANWMAACA